MKQTSMRAPAPDPQPPALPIYENRIAAALHAQGVDLAPAEFLVRQARYVRKSAAECAGQKDSAARLAQKLAYMEAHPQCLLGDEWGPQATPSLPPAWQSWRNNEREEEREKEQKKEQNE